jgi:hypothetical protein
MKSLATIFAVLVLACPAVTWAADCAALSKEAEAAGTQIPAYMSGRNVTGSGRLQFYSAPSLDCKLAGTFILSGESVDAYTEQGGFTFVYYLNPRNGSDAMGWVQSARLQENGRGMGPKPKAN